MCLGMACNTYGQFFAQFDTAPGSFSDGASAPSTTGWTLIPTHKSITDPNDPLSNVHAFVLGESSGNLRMDTTITGGVTIVGTDRWNGEADFTATIGRITFQLTRYNGEGEEMLVKTWYFEGLKDTVTIKGNGDTARATFDSGLLSYTFPSSMATPGTYSLAWQMTGVSLSGGGSGKNAGFEGDIVLDAAGVVIPEAQEFALIAGLGLAAFAGWRRVRT